MQPGLLIRSARRRAGLNQTQLARALGTTQSAVARLESAQANPRVATLRRALAACGERLELETAPVAASIDRTLVARQLRLSPGERLRGLEETHADVRALAGAARRSRG